jgi:outer membrane protein assembly factor BamB
MIYGLAGCSSPSPAKTGPGKVSPSRPRVSEEALKENGLETLLYLGPDSVDNPVQFVELLPDGLFVATFPTENRKGRLKLLNRTSLIPEWYYEIDQRLKAPPSVYRYPQGTSGKPNEVYFSQMDTVYCLDLRHGDLLWRAELGFPLSTRIVADEKNYFAGSDSGRVYGIGKGSCVDEWSFKTGGAVSSSPVVEAANVFFTSTDGWIYRFATPTGWVSGSSWKKETGARILGDPILASRWVIAGSADYKLYCLESLDGSVFWAFQAEGPIEDTPVAFTYRPSQDYVYTIAVQRTTQSEVRTLFAVKLSNGQEAWRQKGIRKVVCMGKQNLYVITDAPRGEKRSLLALDVLTGEEKFRIPVEGFDFVPLNSADLGRNPKQRGVIYLVSEDGTIQVIGERL